MLLGARKEMNVFFTADNADDADKPEKEEIILGPEPKAALRLPFGISVWLAPLALVASNAPG